jgi:hypothetical protein
MTSSFMFSNRPFVKYRVAHRASHAREHPLQLQLVIVIPHWRVLCPAAHDRTRETVGTEVATAKSKPHTRQAVGTGFELGGFP